MVSEILKIRECSFIDIKHKYVSVSDIEGFSIKESLTAHGFGVWSILVAEKIICDVFLAWCWNSFPFDEVVCLHTKSPTCAWNLCWVLFIVASFHSERENLVVWALAGPCYQKSNNEQNTELRIHISLFLLSLQLLHVTRPGFCSLNRRWQRQVLGYWSLLTGKNRQTFLLVEDIEMQRVCLWDRWCKNKIIWMIYYLLHYYIHWQYNYNSYLF